MKDVLEPSGWPVLALDRLDGVTVLLFRDTASVLGWLSMDGVPSVLLDVYRVDGQRLVPVPDEISGQPQIRLRPDGRGPQLQELSHLLAATFWRSGQPLTGQPGHSLVLEAMARAVLP